MIVFIRKGKRVYSFYLKGKKKVSLYPLPPYFYKSIGVDVICRFKEKEISFIVEFFFFLTEWFQYWYAG